MRWLHIASIASFGLASPVLAQTYELSAAAADSSMVGYIDWGSVRREGRQVTVWNLWVYTPPLEVGDGEHISYALRQNLYDCRDETTTQKYVALYLLNGRPGLTGPAANGRAEPWIPNTMGMDIAAKVCDPTYIPTDLLTFEQAFQVSGRESSVQ